MSRKPTATKTCPICKEHKSAEEFHLRRVNKDGLWSYCKRCVRARNEEWRAANPDKLREQRDRANAVRQSANKVKDGGYLYVIVNHTLLPGYCKVGRTTNLKGRLVVYNGSDPNRGFSYHHTRFVSDPKAAEAALLKRMAGFKHSGEWMQAHADDARTLIESLRT